MRHNLGHSKHGASPDENTNCGVSSSRIQKLIDFCLNEKCIIYFHYQYICKFYDIVIQILRIANKEILTQVYLDGGKILLIQTRSDMPVME